MQPRELSEMERATVRFLKQEVNRAQDDFFRRSNSRDKNVSTNLWQARENLKCYVTELRALNKRI